MSKPDNKNQINKQVSHSDASLLYGGRSPVVNAHLDTIEDYVVKMAPGMQVTDDVGRQKQYELFNAIMGILSLDNVQDMIQGMDEILLYFKIYSNGALNSSYTQRYTDLMPVDDSQRGIYTTLCIIFSTFADDRQRSLYGSKFQLTGDGNALQNMNPDIRNRLVQYLNRKLS